MITASAKYPQNCKIDQSYNKNKNSLIGSELNLLTKHKQSHVANHNKDKLKEEKL